MKVTRKFKTKLCSFGMAFAMVFGLSSAPALTAYAQEAVEISNEPTDVVEKAEVAAGIDWYNENLYDSLDEAKAELAGVTAENQMADKTDNYLSDSGEVVETLTFKDTSSAADYVRKCLVERRSTIKFVYNLGYTYYTTAYGEMLAEDAWDEIFDKAIAETPNADEGDYLYWHLAGIEGTAYVVTQTDTTTLTITPTYSTTAAQEAKVTNKVNKLLDKEFDGWEKGTDISNTRDVYWYLIKNFTSADEGDTSDIYTAAYAGFAKGKTFQLGYTTAAYRLLKEMGVSNRIVINSSKNNVWNIVGISGEYYHFDSFLGDLVYEILKDKDLSEVYLLVGSDFIDDQDYDFFKTFYHRMAYIYDKEFQKEYPMTDEDYLNFDAKKEDKTKVSYPTVGVKYHTHVQSFGWEVEWKKNGEMSGTSGQAKRLEGIEIKLSGVKELDLGIEYKTHIQSYGWESEWKQSGEMSGTSGQAKRLEAIMIRLTGDDSAKYDIYYRVHAQSYGWLGWAKNGEEAGTAGQGKRLEGIEIVVCKKGKTPDTGIIGYSYVEYGKSAEQNSEITGLVNYRTHVQSYGWQGYVYDGSLSGTYGEGKRLEGIDISLGNTGYSGGIKYSTHIQSIGWQEWKTDGEMSGTSGQAKRLEAIKIKLTGTVAKHYDVYYRVHAQSYGWLDWAKNGQEAGTAGYGKRLEAIQIVLLPKGSAAPGATARPYVAK